MIGLSARLCAAAIVATVSSSTSAETSADAGHPVAFVCMMPKTPSLERFDPNTEKNRLAFIADDFADVSKPKVGQGNRGAIAKYSDPSSVIFGHDRIFLVRFQSGDYGLVKRIGDGVGNDELLLNMTKSERGDWHDALLANPENANAKPISRGACFLFESATVRVEFDKMFPSATVNTK